MNRDDAHFFDIFDAIYRASSLRHAADQCEWK
jgi:hypothetical protein